ECVASESLGERAVEAYERALGIIAAQCVQSVARRIKRPDLVTANPKGVFGATGPQHAHAQAAVFFLVLGNPGFLRRTRRKDSAGEDIVNHYVPIAADAAVGDWIVRGFVGVEGDGDKGWSRLAACAARD